MSHSPTRARRVASTGRSISLRYWKIVCRRCGFTSPETFLRAFKRLVGVSPTEYPQRFAA